jgi:hypothetical protein
LEDASPGGIGQGFVDFGHGDFVISLKSKIAKSIVDARTISAFAEITSFSRRGPVAQFDEIALKAPSPLAGKGWGWECQLAHR